MMGERTLFERRKRAHMALAENGLDGAFVRANGGQDDVVPLEHVLGAGLVLSIIG